MADEKIAGAPVETQAAQPDPVAAPESKPAKAAVVTTPPIATPTPPAAQPVAAKPLPTLTQAANQRPPQASEASKLAEQLRAELEAAKAARAALDAREQQAASKERVAFLRTAGAIDSLSDDHLLQLAPQVDVRTKEGRDAIAEWTEQNSALFQLQQTSTVEIREQMLSNLQSSQHGVFGKDLHEKLMRNIMRSGKG